jgi:hypothetical protein
VIEPWTLLTKLTRVLSRHSQAYLVAAAADAALLARDLRRRLLAAVIALAGAALCLALGVAWIVGAVWNTPWRNPVLATMLGVFALCAVIGAALALRPHKASQRPLARPGGESSIDQATPGDTFPRSTVMRLLLSVTGLTGSALR